MVLLGEIKNILKVVAIVVSLPSESGKWTPGPELKTTTSFVCCYPKQSIYNK